MKEQVLLLPIYFQCSWNIFDLDIAEDIALLSGCYIADASLCMYSQVGLHVHYIGQPTQRFG